MKRIVFVCTGNTCRSPMAESILRQMAKQKDLEIEVQSAGIAAVEGMAMSSHAKEVLNEKGIKDEVFSKPLTKELIDGADLILTMTGTHKDYILNQYPDTAEKVFTLKEYVDGENNQNHSHHNIADPFGGSLEEYRQCAQQIEAACTVLVEKLSKE